jgi:hypothetical protein
MLTTSLLVSLLVMSAPAASDRYGAFAFPNAAGTELLIRHNLPNPERLHTAVCGGGRKVAVRFVRRQPAGQEHARDTPADFSQAEGTVFHVLNARLDPKSTCFIAEDAMLAGADVLRLNPTAKPTTCTADQQGRIAAVRSRGIASCWTLATASPQISVAVVEYARAGRDALASVIVVAGRNRNVSIDFPAEFTADGDDLWRVEDGGHLSPEGFSVPFLLRQGTTLLVPLAWGAAEGVSLHVYAAEGSAPARDVISDYWYRAPR